MTKDEALRLSKEAIMDELEAVTDEEFEDAAGKLDDALRAIEKALTNRNSQTVEPTVSNSLIVQTQALRLAEEVIAGILHGTDWNLGTNAKIYRPKFPKALAVIRAALVDTVDTTEKCVDKTVECGHEPVAWINPKDLEVLLKLKENYQSDIICGYQMGKDAADPKDRGVPLYAAPVKHVAVVDEVATRLDGTQIFNAIGNVEVGQKLYTAPVEPVKSEPVAWMSPNKERLEFSRKDTVYGSHTIPLYTTPQPRQSVDLTDREIYELWVSPNCCDDYVKFARALLAKHKEKNK